MMTHHRTNTLHTLPLTVVLLELTSYRLCAGPQALSAGNEKKLKKFNCTLNTIDDDKDQS